MSELQNGCKSVDWTEHCVPAELLDRPTDNAVWEHRFLMTQDIDPIRATIDQILQIHIVGITSDNQYYQVAISESCIEWFRSISVLVMTQNQVCTYALKEAQSVFIENAMEAAVSYGKGLRLYYQTHTSDACLLAGIRWAFLSLDILASVNIRQFAQSCVILALNMLGEKYELDNVLFDRTENDWTCFFANSCDERAKAQAFKPLAEMQLVSLLQVVLEFASKITSYPPPTFDSKIPAADTFRMLSAFLDCSTDPKSDLLCEVKMNRLILDCKIFEGCDEKYVTVLRRMMGNYVPISFWLHLPAVIESKMQDETKNALRGHIARIYRSASSLQETEYDMLVLLCWSEMTKKIDAAICEWVILPEGISFYRQMMQGFREQETPDQTSLRLLALLSFERFRAVSEVPNTYEMICPHTPVFGYYLEDFRALLSFKALSNSRSVLERMAASLHRNVDGKCSSEIRCFFDMVKKLLPLHAFDGFSDIYWGFKLQLDVKDPWRKTQEKITEDINRVRGLI